MKIYLKILLSTLAIQIVMVALGFVLTFEPGRAYRVLPILSVVGYIISLITDIYLAVKSNVIWYKKLIYIFLMPTNYTPIGLR